jgi:PAS domain S-box-containing protein
MKADSHMSRATDSHYRRVLNMIPYGVVETGAAGDIQIYNSSFRQLCQCEEETILGQYLWDVIEPRAVKGLFKARFLSVISSPTTASPLFARIASGAAEIEVMVEWETEVDGDGQVVSVVAVFSDVTEQQRISGAADKLANVVRQSSESIVLTDLDGTIQYVNPMFESLTGYAFDEVKGQNPRVLRSEKNLYPPDYYKDLWITISSGNTWKGEFLNKRKNGNEFVEEASIFPVRDPVSGNITGYGAVKTDITRRRQLEQELKRSYKEVLLLKQQAESANRMKSFFLANMSHDIRTPLNGILGFADLLLKQDLEEKTREYVKKIISSGQTLMALLSDILDFSKIEAGQLDIQAGTFELKLFLSDLESMFEAQFKDKGLEFHIQPPPEGVEYIHHDKWRLHQVLMNLLSNGLKFTETGSVTLDVSMDGDEILLFRVSDTGPGIPSDYIHEVFNPFSQVKSHSVQHKKGTGLGLAICKNLVTLMGGQISLESKVGEGSTFFVRLPLNSRDTLPPEKNTDTCDIPPFELDKDIFPSTILIAEDNPVNKELLEEQLREYGFTSLLFAADGQEALDLALEKQPALVLMDIQMPRMDGKEAIRELRSRNFRQPILVMSAFAMQDDIDSALRVGADGYITKPVDFDRFFYEVRKLLSVSDGNPHTGNTDDVPSCCLEKDKGRWLRFSPGVSPRLRSIFMKDAGQKLETLNRVASARQLREFWNEVKTIAHGYKGSAAHFGLSCLEKLSRQLDEGMRDGLPEQKLMAYLRQLSTLLEHIIEENK